MHAPFAWARRRIGVHYTRSGPFTISIARRADVARLDALMEETLVSPA